MLDANKLINETKNHMAKAIEHLETELAKIRAGRANPAMLEGVKVDYYGSMVPLSQVSNISTPDARSLAIQPWEKSMVTPIEKQSWRRTSVSILKNDGLLVRINVPPLTEERRKELVKKPRRKQNIAK